MSTVKLKDEPSFKDFLGAITQCSSVRLVKLEDYGFTAPVTKEGTVVIQPMVRLVATAFDKQSDTIYRWQETTEARRGVSIQASTRRGAHEEAAVLMEKDRVRQTLQLEGFSVEKGEWTPASVETLLGRTGT